MTKHVPFPGAAASDGPLSGLPGGAVLLDRNAQRPPQPHPPLLVEGPDGVRYVVPVAIVLGVEANTNAALAAMTAKLVIAELERRGVIPAASTAPSEREPGP